MESTTVNPSHELPPLKACGPPKPAVVTNLLRRRRDVGITCAPQKVLRILLSTWADGSPDPPVNLLPVVPAPKGWSISHRLVARLYVAETAHTIITLDEGYDLHFMDKFTLSCYCPQCPYIGKRKIIIDSKPYFAPWEHQHG